MPNIAFSVSGTPGPPDCRCTTSREHRTWHLFHPERLQLCKWTGVSYYSEWVRAGILWGFYGLLAIGLTGLVVSVRRRETA